MDAQVLARSRGRRWRHLSPVVVAAGMVLTATTSSAPQGGAAGSGPVTAGTSVVPFAAPGADGVVLRGHVYRPAREGPVATVLQLSPYWNTVKGPGERQGDSAAVRPFVDAGFAVALVNLRGTGESDGCFQWGSRLDWADTSAVITALAAEPWSNGRVGMYGTSYEGWTQFMALANPPPALKAVVPISGVIDVWSLLTRRGAPISIGPAAGAAWDLTNSRLISETTAARHAACSDLGPHTAEGLQLVTSGNRTPYYADRDLRPFVSGSEVPVLLANGLRYLAEGHTLQFEGLWDALRPDRTRFQLGQWGHGGARLGFTELAVGWFDHYLRGGPATTRPGVVEYQDDAGTWHETDRWPPRSRPATLHLSGERLVAGAAAVEPSRRRFESLDLEVPGTATPVLPGREADPPPATPLVCGPHQVVYASAPLAEDVLLAGNFTVDLTVSATEPGGNLVATLYHGPGDAGSCAELATAARDSGRVQLDLRHWQEPGASRPFPVATPTRVTATSLPLAAAVPAGHRIIIAVGAASAELLPDPLKPTITVETGAGRPGSLTLPLARGTLRFR